MFYITIPEVIPAHEMALFFYKIRNLKWSNKGRHAPEGANNQLKHTHVAFFRGIFVSTLMNSTTGIVWHSFTHTAFPRINAPKSVPWFTVAKFYMKKKLAETRQLLELTAKNIIIHFLSKNRGHFAVLFNSSFRMIVQNLHIYTWKPRVRKTSKACGEYVGNFPSSFSRFRSCYYCRHEHSLPFYSSWAFFSVFSNLEGEIAVRVRDRKNRRIFFFRLNPKVSIDSIVWARWLDSLDWGEINQGRKMTSGPPRQKPHQNPQFPHSLSAQMPFFMGKNTKN